MFALDEIQRGDTRRERIDGGIASRRFEKSRTMGQRKLKYGRRRGNGPLRPDTHPWHVKTIGPPIGEFPIDGSDDCRTDTLSLPASRHIYAHAYVRGNARIIERRRSTWPGLCRSDERKEISNQIWEAQPGGSRIRLSDPCFHCFAGKHHFHDRRNDFLSKAKLYSRTYMVMYFQGLFVYISARSCHVIVLSSTNKRE